MLEEQIQMVDLHGQYLRFKEEIDGAMQAVIDSCAFINGPQVKTFAGHLAGYLQVPFVIPCGNGTDALQIALMALELQPGDEVILPAFTYIAAAEVVAMLGLTPVLVDVDPGTFEYRSRENGKRLFRNGQRRSWPSTCSGNPAIWSRSWLWQMPIICMSWKITPNPLVPIMSFPMGGCERPERSDISEPLLFSRPSRWPAMATEVR